MRVAPLEVEQFAAHLEPAKQTQFPAPSWALPRLGLYEKRHIRGVRLQSGSATGVGKVESYGVFMHEVCVYYDTPVADAQLSLEVEQFEEPLEPAKQPLPLVPSWMLARFSLYARRHGGDWTNVFYDAGSVLLELVLGLNVVCFVWIDVVLSGAAITRCYRQQVCGYYDTPVPDAQWCLEVEQFAGPLEPASQPQSLAALWPLPRFSPYAKRHALVPVGM
ncbi:hypothetical protein, conserved [Eimeria brunetti]|uniref:Uncharacterized protein n=1 Tax=Eimeria brunetti TaxID=51314 RepID=U6M011_9EIME|nr:hypothetical protein, conserved [Eimeria brunetti]